jgi:hypothetical protein
MQHSDRIKAYEKINTLDSYAIRNIKLRAFLNKHPYLRDALNSSFLQSACHGEEEALKEAFDIARDLKEALIKEGLEDITEEEYLQAVLETPCPSAG